MESKNSQAMMSGAESQPRKLASWINGFIDYTNGIPSPKLFRKWSAISAVAGALERRCYVTTAQSALYPNLYIVLVAPPGIGKSRAIENTEKLWRGTSVLHICSTSVTKAALMDELKTALRTDITATNSANMYHSLQVCAGELGALISKHDLEFMSILNYVYDCPEIYCERRRSAEDVLQIDHPQLNLLAGTQPGFLSELFSDQAFELGTTSRIMFVYSEEKVQVDLFGLAGSTKEEKEDLLSSLRHDLLNILNLRGEFQWTEEAKSYVTNWYENINANEAPTEIKFLNYCTRRPLMLLKLCQIFSASRTDALLIDEQDAINAHQSMLEVEKFFPQVVKGMNHNPHATLQKETFSYLLGIYHKTKKPIPEQRLHYFLSQFIEEYKIGPMIEGLIKSSIIKVVDFQKGKMKGTAAPTMRMFQPLELNQHGQGDEYVDYDNAPTTGTNNGDIL